MLKTSFSAKNSDKNRMKRLVVRLATLCVILIPFTSTDRSTAAFSTKVARTHVEIEGVNYGVFDHVSGLTQDAAFVSTGIPASTPSIGATTAGTEDQHRYRKISLRRDFVTDPSLYLWAKNLMHERGGLKDVNLVLENRDGEELGRYVLRLCQPLSWTVEAANPALGGFHEVVDLAVQDVVNVTTKY